MTVYTNIFGGSNIFPSDVSYESVTLTADETYFWPVEAAPGQNLIASIVDVTASAGPFAIILPDATQASTGQTIFLTTLGQTRLSLRTLTACRSCLRLPVQPGRFI
jgi:hypothetical protein